MVWFAMLKIYSCRESKFENHVDVLTLDALLTTISLLLSRQANILNVFIILKQYIRKIFLKLSFFTKLNVFVTENNW